MNNNMLQGRSRCRRAKGASLPGGPGIRSSRESRLASQTSARGAAACTSSAAGTISTAPSWI